MCHRNYLAKGFLFSIALVIMVINVIHLMPCKRPGWWLLEFRKNAKLKYENVQNFFPKLTCNLSYGTRVFTNKLLNIASRNFGNIL